MMTMIVSRWRLSTFIGRHAFRELFIIRWFQFIQAATHMMLFLGYIVSHLYSSLCWYHDDVKFQHVAPRACARQLPKTLKIEMPLYHRFSRFHLKLRYRLLDVMWWEGWFIAVRQLQSYMTLSACLKALNKVRTHRHTNASVKNWWFWLFMQEQHAYHRHGIHTWE